MDFSYYKAMEPFWGTWRIKKMIGEGSFGKVFEIEREDFGRTYKAAMKVITIPQSESEFKSVLADGMDLQSATSYYKSFVEEVVDEFALMASLKGNSNIVSYEDHTVIEHKDGVGWDILIRMELLTPLLDYTSTEHPMERKDVIKLGIDICKALEYCQRQNIIHRDIKPENIFISPVGDYKLGDFGIARTVEKTTSGLSRKGTYTYMAPEVYKGETYDATVDIYSLGIVLYRLLNKNRTPFLPLFPEPITHSDRENSIVKRVGGEPLPVPEEAGDKLGKIILKACAYEPKDRYRKPEQMRMDLEAELLAVPEESFDGDDKAGETERNNMSKAAGDGERTERTVGASAKDSHRTVKTAGAYAEEDRTESVFGTYKGESEKTEGTSASAKDSLKTGSCSAAPIEGSQKTEETAVKTDIHSKDMDATVSIFDDTLVSEKSDWDNPASDIKSRQDEEKKAEQGKKRRKEGKSRFFL